MCGVSRVAEFLLWMFVVSRVKTVTCQKFEGFVGSSILLPCIYKETLPPMASIFWRDKDDSNVLDIVKNKTDISNQSGKFRGRVTSFSEQFKDGNYSITLEKLQLSDSSSYVCYIPKVSFQQRVVLTVSDKRVVMSMPPPSMMSTTPGPSGGSTAVTTNSLHMFLLCLPLFLLFTP